MLDLTGTTKGSIERTGRSVKMIEILSRLVIDTLGIGAQTEWNQWFVNQLSNEFRHELRVSNEDLGKERDALSGRLSQRRPPTSG